ncbi:uncharacterized protein LOC105279135 isoform X2 [Ooceraea biroi]|uniref:uncharacterized protein LOC105279135 isoform X2 n=1 Tax=Ooceraea biroi TaxID=2015173 RepID=UPI0009717096|nr:uncharacterized protein LOC105279135 isoform X2 [Ooceraea biroi]
MEVSPPHDLFRQEAKKADCSIKSYVRTARSVHFIVDFSDVHNTRKVNHLLNVVELCCLFATFLKSILLFFRRHESVLHVVLYNDGYVDVLWKM